MYMGYVLGAWPPQKKSPPEAVRAFAGLLRGHAAAAAALRAADPGARIGVANNVMLLEPKSRLMLGDWLGSMFVDQFWNWAFADAIRDGRARLRLPGATLDERIDGLAGSADFFGLNYYFRYFVRLAPGTPEMFAMTPGPGLRSELGGNDPIGDSPPEALFLLMREAWKRYRLPIAITEGGIADERGTMRGPLIRGQFEAIQRARAEGIAVTGYFHWSLARQLRVGEGLPPALRPLPRRPADARPHAGGRLGGLRRPGAASVGRDPRSAAVRDKVGFLMKTPTLLASLLLAGSAGAQDRPFVFTVTTSPSGSDPAPTAGPGPPTTTPATVRGRASRSATTASSSALEYRDALVPASLSSATSGSESATSPPAAASRPRCSRTSWARAHAFGSPSVSGPDVSGKARTRRSLGCASGGAARARCSSGTP